MTIHSFFENYGDRYFNGLDMSKLKMDKAYLIIDNIRNDKAYVYSAYKECINCPLLDDYGNISANITDIIPTDRAKIYKVLTKYVNIHPSQSRENVLCDINTEFGEFGVYHLLIGERNCTLNTLKEPVNIYLPIFTVFCICAFLFGTIALFKFFLKIILVRLGKIDANQRGLNNTDVQRIQSLDTFRGIAITIMIFINYGCGEYKFIDHALWNGLHLADVIFPCFLWIMGFCIPITVKAALKRNDSTKTVMLSITRRSAILFALGMSLSSGTDLNNLRIFGILQRLSICYFIVTLIYYVITKLWNSNMNFDNSDKAFSDIARFKIGWIIMILIFMIHTYIVFFIPFGNCPRGYFGPGGLHENGIYQNCTGGITGYIDRIILGDYIFQWSSFRKIYHAQAMDPEGILSTLPAILLVFFGVQANITLMTYKDHKKRLIRWFNWATIFGMLGGILCGFSKDDGLIPINNHLWSASYVCVTSGLAFFALALCYLLVDVEGVWSGKPFTYAGRNAIFLYIGHTLAYNNIPFHWYFDDKSTHFISLLANVFASIFWLLLSFILYKKEAFLVI